MGFDPGFHGEALRCLDRVLSSPGFARNERMSRFLRFIVEQHLAGRDDDLKESVIGVEVFGRRPDFDPKLDSIVRTEAGRLRSRLAEYYAGAGCDDRVVFEVPRGGYVPTIRTAARPASPAVAPRVRQATWSVVLALLATVAISAAWWARPRTTEPIPIAVLPLTNLSDDAADAYFADGLTDEVIRNLSAVEGLAVRSRTSAFAVRREPRNVGQIGSQLNVDYLVEGSVQRDGGRLRVNARLIRVRDDSPVWSRQFDREMTDVFAIQDEIARGIVNELRLNLGRGRWRYETSVAAYDQYLRARAAGASDLRAAFDTLPLLEQVIALDPSFAPAYADLGRVHALRSVQFPLPHPPDELDRMRSMAERAVALDPLLAEGHAAVGLAHARLADWSAAEQSFRQAIALAPSAGQIRSDYAMWVLHVTGRNEEALEELRLALESDPLSSDAHISAAWVLLALSRTEEAVAHCAATPDAASLKHVCLGRVALASGRIDEARALFETASADGRSPHSRGFLGLAILLSGERELGASMFDTATAPTERVLIAAGSGDIDASFAALDSMASVGAQRVGQFLNYPELAVLRQDPRFTELKKRVRLPVDATFASEPR